MRVKFSTGSKALPNKFRSPALRQFLGALPLIAVLAGCGSMSPAPLTTASSGCATQATVDHWIYDTQGNKFGSVRALTNGGQSATIMVGSYFEPGSHEAVVPACEITVAADGRATLHPTSIEALNALPSR